MKKELIVLIDGLRKFSAEAAAMADALEGKDVLIPAGKAETASAPVEIKADVEVSEVLTPVTENQKTEPEDTEPEDTNEEPAYTKEDVRTLLAHKSSQGFRKEVRELLKQFGAHKLSDLDDKTNLYAEIMKAAEGIGNA